MRHLQRIIGILLTTLLIVACGQTPVAQPTGTPGNETAALPTTAPTTAPAPTEVPTAQPTVAPEPLAVMASTTIVADVVRQIGGERVKVETIVPPGADGHNYEPTPQDLARVSTARIIFTVGAGYEEFLDRLIASSGTKAEVVSLSENLALRTLREEEVGNVMHSHEHGDEHGDEHGVGATDPHTWTDPSNVKIWVDVIASNLSRLDPANGSFYTERAAAYQRQLDELDRWIAEQFAAIPAERRLIVADHILFGYMADRYGLQQVGAIIPGVSTSATPSAQELAALQDLITKRGIKAIFVGEIANSQLAEQIARDTGAKIVTVLTETLTDANGPGATYIDYMRFNVQQIVNALR
ncbi:metal ABC transporter substrate-binding protein [Chloroflexus aggregans]|uniref:Periplasmic solute binding protein n=1 Tax=Chloroflexus aggregans (strain MD-66 / DSM 9485) TaxID=326427 RepID=B8GBW4_CHLAD|nr:metal ABC transporter substrate-binding protein [Chloroflexus aggregans]ACL24931.1 periplasmic solute binding protein [Chloroflexus aggregans DSM 9485]